MATATATLTRWGTSAGIVIPKALLNDLRLSVGDKLDIRQEGRSIVLTPQEPEWTLSSLMAGYDGPPPEVIDCGEPVGREVW